MINIDDFISFDRNDNQAIREISKSLNAEIIAQLVPLLEEKIDDIRYPVFLILKDRSSYSGDVFPYFDVFTEKLNSDNSYQRSIGLMLFAANAQWDNGKKVEENIDKYLNCINDEKPITIRQCIQALANIIPYKKELYPRIMAKLMNFDLNSVKETMRKSILTDILNALILMNKQNKDDKIIDFIYHTLSGGLLDSKTKKQFENML